GSSFCRKVGGGARTVTDAGYPFNKGSTHAHALLLTRLEFDGGAHLTARDRRRFRTPSGIARTAQAVCTGIPGDQSGSQGANPHDRRAPADRGRGDPLLFGKTLPRE